MKKNTKDRSVIIYWVVIAILIGIFIGALKWAAPYLLFFWMLR